jgi:hypothetical protein
MFLILGGNWSCPVVVIAVLEHHAIIDPARDVAATFINRCGSFPAGRSVA